jgi:hypothetical protein
MWPTLPWNWSTSLCKLCNTKLPFILCYFVAILLQIFHPLNNFWGSYSNYKEQIILENNALYMQIMWGNTWIWFPEKLSGLLPLTSNFNLSCELNRCNVKENKSRGRKYLLCMSLIDIILKRRKPWRKLVLATLKKIMVLDLSGSLKTCTIIKTKYF